MLDRAVRCRERSLVNLLVSRGSSWHSSYVDARDRGRAPVVARDWGGECSRVRAAPTAAALHTAAATTTTATAASSSGAGQVRSAAATDRVEPQWTLARDRPCDERGL